MRILSSRAEREEDALVGLSEPSPCLDGQTGFANAFLLPLVLFSFLIAQATIPLSGLDNGQPKLDHFHADHDDDGVKKVAVFQRMRVGGGGGGAPFWLAMTMSSHLQIASAPSVRVWLGRKRGQAREREKRQRPKWSQPRANKGEKLSDMIH